MARRPGSIRTPLRAFQAMRAPDSDTAFVIDLEYLENRDLDLSIRLGAVLAFNALMITIGTHPISASPGAPLSLDAAAQPWMTIASSLSIVPGIISSALALRALLIGEEVETSGLEGDALRHRLLAAFVHSIDAQSALLNRAVRWTMGGGAAILATWAWILAAKMIG